MTDNRQFSPATQRNREPILAVLQAVLPPTGSVLEVSSGTGEHSVFFAPRLQPRRWLTSDPNPVARASISAWQAQEPSPNLYPPLALDASAPVWPVEPLPAEFPQPELFKTDPITAIVNINMIHISPWAAGLGLLAGAGRLLPPGGVLYLYGPYRRNGQHTAPSNQMFDQSLRSQNSDWGVRDLEAVVAAAADQGLTLVKTVEMPANNLSVVFQR
jgi:SAM-dependent methyltransferase